MTTLTTSAPGKIVLCGEYAVLAGAPAIAVAVDRRARVSLQQSDGEGVVRTLSDAEGEYRFGIDDSGAIKWQDSADVPLFDQVWRTAGYRSTMQVTLDTREFFAQASGEKYGFGSSAAVTTALMLALDVLAGVEGGLCDRAASAHRDFQGGRGSGVDIATSVRGGLISFNPGAQDTGLAWPRNLHWSVVWTGRGIGTGQQLRKLGAMDAGDPDTQALLQNSRAAADAWSGGDAASILAEMRRFSDSLQQFSDARQLGVFAGGHDELRQLAKRIGILYKPCGAGGGDIGAAFAEDEAAIAAFATAASAAGFSILQVSPDPRGASIDSEYDDE